MANSTDLQMDFKGMGGSLSPSHKNLLQFADACIAMSVCLFVLDVQSKQFQPPVTYRLPELADNFE